MQDWVGREEVPAWMVKGRTVLIQQDFAKRIAVSNYLPLLWKLLTGVLAGKFTFRRATYSLMTKKAAERGREGRRTSCWLTMLYWRRRRRGIWWWHGLIIRRRMTRFHTQLKSLGLIKVANIEGLLSGSMKGWKTVLIANGETLVGVGGYRVVLETYLQNLGATFFSILCNETFSFFFEFRQFLTNCTPKNCCDSKFGWNIWDIFLVSKYGHVIANFKQISIRFTTNAKNDLTMKNRLKCKEFF